MVDQHGRYRPISLQKINHRFETPKTIRISNRVVNRRSNLAVLTPTVPFIHSEFSRPICLPDISVNIAQGAQCETTQWDTNERLMVHSTVKIRNCNGGDICVDRNGLKVQHLGAPLVCRVSHGTQDYVILVGISKGQEGSNQLYSKMTNHLDWLQTAGMLGSPAN